MQQNLFDDVQIPYEIKKLSKGVSLFMKTTHILKTCFQNMPCFDKQVNSSRWLFWAALHQGPVTYGCPS